MTPGRPEEAPHHYALPSRIVVEQARGVIAERTGLDMEDTFSWLQNHASSLGIPLIDAAQFIVDGTATSDPPSP